MPRTLSQQLAVRGERVVGTQVVDVLPATVFTRERGVVSCSKDDYRSGIRATILEDIPTDDRQQEALMLRESRFDPCGVMFDLVSSRASNFCGLPSLWVEPFVNDGEGNDTTVWQDVGEVQPYPEKEFAWVGGVGYLGGIVDTEVSQVIQQATGLTPTASSPFIVTVDHRWGALTINYIASENGSPQPRWQSVDVDVVPQELVRRSQVVVSADQEVVAQLTDILQDDSSMHCGNPFLLMMPAEVAEDGAETFFESGRWRTPEEISERIILPEDPDDFPHMVFFISPARSGSTGFMLWAASQPSVYQAFFQLPGKGIGRGIVPYMAINEPPSGNNKVAFVKETTGPMFQAELFDPVEILLMAATRQYGQYYAVAEKISVICGLRDPEACFSSLKQFVPVSEVRPNGMDLDYYAEMQQHIIDLYHRYVELLGDGRVMPFVFELLKGDTRDVVQRLCRRIGLDLESDFSLDFDDGAIGQKVEFGEADAVIHPIYYGEIINPTRRIGTMEHVSGTKKSVPPSPEEVQFLRQRCYPGYQEFRRLAVKRLEI